MPSSAPRPRHFPAGKLLFALLSAAILVAAAGGGALLAYQGRYADRVYPGVSVEGIDLGGLDRAGARAALEQGLAHYGQGAVSVAVGGRTIAIPFSSANRRADINALLDEAFAVGRGGDPAGGVRALLAPTALAPTVLVDQAPLAAAVERAARTVDSGKVDAGATVTESGFATTPSATGAQLDQGSLTSAILRALGDPASPSQVALTGTLNPLAPRVSDADAAAAVAAANAMVSDVVVTFGKESWTIPAATVRPWVTFTVDAAGRPVPSMMDGAPAAAVDALRKSFDKAPVEASFTFGSNLKVKVTPSADGRTLDVASTAAAVAVALRARAGGSPAGSPAQVAAVATVTHPKLTTAAARASAPKVRMISTWTTYYPVGAHNGFGNNITIPAREINGTVVAPGGTFDWWNALHVTAATTDGQLLRRGYRYGGAIINGHSAEGKAIAGGICSASTTLFNAVARAGFQIDSRFNHYYFIDRYPTGMDATVVYGSKNLRWTNDTKYPVMVKGRGTPGVVNFTLYTVAANNRKAVGGGAFKPGKPHVTYQTAIGRKVVITSSGLSNWLSPGAPYTQITHNRSEGGQVIDYPLPGFNVTVWRTVYEKGKVIHRDKWFSHYQMMRLLTLRYVPLGTTP